MDMRARSAALCFALTALAGTSGLAAADPVTATINLTTVDGKACVVTTTDAAGLHLEPNGTSFMAELATLSGPGCGGGTGTGAQPPTTPFILTPAPNPLVATVGQPFTVSWTLTGGVQPIACSGTISGAPAGATLTDWVQTAAASIGTNSRQVTPTAADVGSGTAPASFTMNLTCSNSDGAITSAALPITVNPISQGDSCPAPETRITKAELCYRNGVSNCTTDNGADNLTTFPIWLGRAFDGSGIAPSAPPYLNFPGPTGAGPTFSIAQGQYVSALLVVPANATIGASGSFSKASGNITNFTNADFSISSTCGDFDSASIPITCKATNVPNDGVLARWVIGQTSSTKCRLNAGQTYYINVRPRGCTNPTCRLRVDG